MSVTKTIPRAFGSVLIIQYTPAPQTTAQPGLAILNDGLHGVASIQDVLIDQASAKDVAAGNVTISDQA